jgi:hypothetical protein
MFVNSFNIMGDGIKVLRQRRVFILYCLVLFHYTFKNYSLEALKIKLINSLSYSYPPASTAGGPAAQASMEASGTVPARSR